MKTRFVAILAAALLLLFGCNRLTQESTTNSPIPPPTNIVSLGKGTNPLQAITQNDAIEIAQKEASRRGRTAMRVDSVWFGRGEWHVGLIFRPEDQIGNYAVVRVSTNGIIKQYIHGL